MNGKKTCQICDLKLPSYNQTFCDSPNINDLDKCLLMRHPVSCKTCQPGYQKDINYFLNFISETDIHKSFFEKIGFWRQNFFDIGNSLIFFNYKFMKYLPVNSNIKFKIVKS